MIWLVMVVVMLVAVVLCWRGGGDENLEFWRIVGGGLPIVTVFVVGWW